MGARPGQPKPLPRQGGGHARTRASSYRRPAAVCVNPGAHPRDGDPVARLSAALVSHRVVQARRQTPVRRLVVKKRWKNKNRSRVGSETSRAPARMTGGGVFE